MKRNSCSTGAICVWARPWDFLPVSLAAADDLLTVAQDAHARRYAQETAPGEEADIARCDIIRKTLETNI